METKHSLAIGSTGLEHGKPLIHRIARILRFLRVPNSKFSAGVLAIEVNVDS